MESGLVKRSPGKLATLAWGARKGRSVMFGDEAWTEGRFKATESSWGLAGGPD